MSKVRACSECQVREAFQREEELIPTTETKDQMLPRQAAVLNLRSCVTSSTSRCSCSHV